MIMGIIIYRSNDEMTTDVVACYGVSRPGRVS